MYLLEHFIYYGWLQTTARQRWWSRVNKKFIYVKSDVVTSSFCTIDKPKPPLNQPFSMQLVAGIGYLSGWLWRTIRLATLQCLWLVCAGMNNISDICFQKPKQKTDGFPYRVSLGQILSAAIKPDDSCRIWALSLSQPVRCFHSQPFALEMMPLSLKIQHAALGWDLTSSWIPLWGPRNLPGPLWVRTA